MSEPITRDPVMGGEVPLSDGETVLAEVRADPRAYWRAHGIMAVALGVVAGVVLVAMGNPDPWVGLAAALPAVGLRAWYLQSEALSHRWRLTERRLLGPGLRAVPRAAIASVRPFFGDVLVVTTGGDKHLVKYPADPAAVARMIGGAE